MLVKQRLYEPPTALNFSVVTPFDPDNREAGVELRCNSQAVASTTWTLHEKSNTVREFHLKLTDENCLYELVAILMRTTDYLYLYQMVPSRAWLLRSTRPRGSSDEEAASEATRAPHVRVPVDPARLCSPLRASFV